MQVVELVLKDNWKNGENYCSYSSTARFIGNHESTSIFDYMSVPVESNRFFAFLGQHLLYYDLNSSNSYKYSVDLSHHGTYFEAAKKNIIKSIESVDNVHELPWWDNFTTKKVDTAPKYKWTVSKNGVQYESV